MLVIDVICDENPNNINELALSIKLDNKPIPYMCLTDAQRKIADEVLLTAQKSLLAKIEADNEKCPF